MYYAALMLLTLSTLTFVGCKKKTESTQPAQQPVTVQTKERVSGPFPVEIMWEDMEEADGK